MKRSIPAWLLPVVGVTVLWSGALASQGKQYPLVSADGLTLHNVTAAPAALQAKKGLRLTLSEAAVSPQQGDIEQLAVIDGLQFSSGVIEAEIAGVPATGAAEGARGFVGIAFRVQQDLKTY